MTEVKCAVACSFCRVKKIKCSGEQPCGNCQDHNTNCLFPPAHVRSRNKLRESNKNLRDRISRLEALIEENKSPNAERVPQIDHDTVEGTGPTPPLGFSTTVCSANPDIMAPRPEIPATSRPFEFVNTIMSQMPGQIPSQLPATPPISNPDRLMTSYGPNEGQERPFICPEVAPEVENEIPEMSPTHSNWEYHGPMSYLSIGSGSAARWLNQQIGASATAASAGQLSFSVTRGMKLDHSIAAEREPEPSSDMAWKYTTAYFENSLDCIFGVVNRRVFENRLRATWAGTCSDDSAWYALRNTVYAAGCKILLTTGNPSFAEDLPWRYFENALSVHTDLLFLRSDITAIQALMQMAFYTEGLGNPALEYMLVSNALRLSQSKGLHLQPLKSWNLSEEEQIERNCLFWTIYAYEKHIAFRSGRPSIIDDCEIGCELITKVTSDSTINLQFFTEVIKHARITSRITRKLNSFKAGQKSVEALLKIANNLEEEVRAWYDAMPSDLKDASLRPSSSTVHPHHILYLHFAYHGSLIAIHSRFIYPWNQNRQGQDQYSSIDTSRSVEIVLESSQQIIMATKRVNPNGSFPTWLIFFYPVLALINVFLHVLRSPSQPSTANNLALVGVAAGHFNYVEFLTKSHISFPYVKEIVNVAQAVSQKAQRQQPQEAMAQSPRPLEGPLGAVDNNFNVLDSQVDEFNRVYTPSSMFGGMSNMDLGLENWPTFVPSLSMVADMADVVMASHDQL